MTTYYKGSIVLRKNLKFKKIKLQSYLYDDAIALKGDDSNIRTINVRYELTDRENVELSDAIKSDSDTLSEKVVNILVKILMSTQKLYRRKEMDIIYEKIMDSYGNIYGKEKITGYIFPLLNEKDLNANIFSYYKRGTLYYDDILFKSCITYETKNRINFDLCDCYCINEGVANKNEIELYDNVYNNFYTNYFAKQFHTKLCSKLKKLYNMNIFDESIIFNNSNNISSKSVTTPNNSNSISNSIQTVNSNNIPSSISMSPVVTQENSTNVSSTNQKLEKLKKVKEILSFLSEEDIALLKDMTNNNLDDPNVLEYLKMSREQKLEFISNKQKTSNDESQISNDKPKISLKKR